MNPRVVAETWLAQQLATVSAHVFRHPAPPEATYPHITVGLRTAVDVRPLGNHASVVRLVYDISVWDVGLSALAANDLAAEINAALDGVPPIAIDAGQIIACKRIGPVGVASVVEEGEVYQRDGGLYELIVLVN